MLWSLKDGVFLEELNVGDAPIVQEVTAAHKKWFLSSPCGQSHSG